MEADTDRLLDTGYHSRRRANRLEDPGFREEYDRAQIEIRQIDDLMRSLDRLRQDLGLTKADLARQIGKNPASIRRLFSAESNPELRTVVAMAAALGAKIEIVVPRRDSRSRSARRTAPA